MRYINNKKLKLTEGWTDRARKAKLAVECGEKTVNQQSAIWGELKDNLHDLSHGKCWYCEIRQDRSYNAVDHFRPKNEVADTVPVHKGYWWLAFDYTNFRYSCTFCNSLLKNPETGLTGGKGAKFPLLPGSPRANKPGEEQKESPMLLDPCIALDPGLLDFLADDGSPCARFRDNPIKQKRAEESIEIYHLNHPSLNEQRRILAVKIDSWIKKANMVYSRCDTGDPISDQTFDEIVCNLADAMSEKAELSSFAKRMISGSRNIEWVEQLFLT